jgi:ribosomal protein S18 acetylase RimI-like enzyme
MIDESISDPDALPGGRRELLEALALAFRDNPMNVAIHGPRPERRVRANRAGLRALVLDTAGQAVARVIRHDGRVVGGLVVVPPDAYPLPRQGFRRQVGCLIGQGARAMDRWNHVTHELGQYHPVERHWYLAVLGVVPSLQGRGFGNRLIDELLRIRMSDPCPLYLESDREASVRFYLARGFAVRDEPILYDVRCGCLGRGFADRVPDLCDSVREPEVSGSTPRDR